MEVLFTVWLVTITDSLLDSFIYYLGFLCVSFGKVLPCTLTPKKNLAASGWTCRSFYPLKSQIYMISQELMKTSMEPKGAWILDLYSSGGQKHDSMWILILLSICWKCFLKYLQFRDEDVSVWCLQLVLLSSPRGQKEGGKKILKSTTTTSFFPLGFLVKSSCLFGFFFYDADSGLCQKF